MTEQTRGTGAAGAAMNGPAMNGAGPGATHRDSGPADAGARPEGLGNAALAEQVELFRASAQGAMEAAWQAIDSDALLGKVDPASFSVAVARFAAAVAKNPSPAARMTLRYAQQVGAAALTASLRGLGLEQHGPANLPAKDPRFGDPAWQENAAFYLLRQLYTLAESYTFELLDEADLDERVREKARFALGQTFAALAPTNIGPLNPKVLKRAFETGGLSLLRGARNLVRDMATNSGRPRQLDPEEFRIGENIAATPGRVVYRNRLIELIQFAPQTGQVYATPLLFSPPWINKYYVMDLAPHRSLIEWAVQRGHTCFVISYRNPDASMRDVGMSDYLADGPLAALDVVADITGQRKANVVGLCLGGSLSAMMTAWLANKGQDRVNALTLLNTLVDFSMPGELGVLTDKTTVDRLAKTMDEQGYLPAEKMRNTFDLLRSNDLLWNYVVNDWLLGEEPRSFDILSWNGDSTRMPATMHTEYLRSCYLENEFARGKLELAGERISPASVRTQTYIVSAENDHIAPWRSVYFGARQLGGTVRFALSNAGHIAGVVNPPSSKSKHWVRTDTELPEHPEDWRKQADEVAKTWWEDWAAWIAERAGDQVDPPGMGSENHPAGADAPGEYVRES